MMRFLLVFLVCIMGTQAEAIDPHAQHTDGDVARGSAGFAESYSQKIHASAWIGGIKKTAHVTFMIGGFLGLGIKWVCKSVYNGAKELPSYIHFLKSCIRYHLK